MMRIVHFFEYQNMELKQMDEKRKQQQENQVIGNEI